MQLENLEICMELENTWIVPFQVQSFYSIHYNKPELSVQFYNFKSPTSKKISKHEPYWHLWEDGAAVFTQFQYGSFFLYCVTCLGAVDCSGVPASAIPCLISVIMYYGLH